MSNIKNIKKESEQGVENDCVSLPDESVQKVYTFRRLNSGDLFPMIKIISKIGMDELSQVLDGNLVSKLLGKKQENSQEDTENSTQDVKENNSLIVGIGIALRVANKILEHLPSCEQEIYTLLANVSGMETKEIKELDINIFMEMIIDFIKKEEFNDFFKAASKYIKLLGK